MRELAELSPVTYHDYERSISLKCYADTFVYHKVSARERNLVAIRFGGYPEQVRALVDALKGTVTFETRIEDHPVILQTKNTKYKKSISHDGIYAEGTLMALDDDAEDDSKDTEVKRPNNKRRMYIFCEEGNSESLFTELDKKTIIPLIPEFKDYIIRESIKRGVLIPLEVLSACDRYDAYMLQLSKDEHEMEKIVNDGLKNGDISIPNAKQGSDFSEIQTVSGYLNKYGVTIANRIKNSFNPLFEPANEAICDRLKRINGHLKKSVGYSLYPAQLAVCEAVKRRLDKSKVGIIVAECGSGKTKIGTCALAAHQNGRKCFNVVLCPSHLTKKWQREIEETLPNTDAAVVHSISDINLVYKQFLKGDNSVYIIFSKERARDGYMKKPAAVYSQSKKAYICPHCGCEILMKIKDDGVCYEVNADQFFFKKENKENHRCKNCGEILWTAYNPEDKRLSHNKWVKIGSYGFVYRPFAIRHLETTKDLKVIDRIKEIVANPQNPFIAKGAYRRYSMSQYIASKMKVDGLLADELHRAPIRGTY
ncbi:MAG: DEAD/DEAH box helicase family protein [Firmicutes bacterium]|nr:DEAD/DEAH box helicase family protein [Bacillota bacterium]